VLEALILERSFRDHGAIEMADNGSIQGSVISGNQGSSANNRQRKTDASRSKEGNQDRRKKAASQSQSRGPRESEKEPRRPLLASLTPRTDDSESPAKECRATPPLFYRYGAVPTATAAEEAEDTGRRGRRGTKATPNKNRRVEYSDSSSDDGEPHPKSPAQLQASLDRYRSAEYRNPRRVWSSQYRDPQGDKSSSVKPSIEPLPPGKPEPDLVGKIISPQEALDEEEEEEKAPLPPYEREYRHADGGDGGWGGRPTEATTVPEDIPDRDSMPRECGRGPLQCSLCERVPPAVNRVMLLPGRLLNPSPHRTVPHC